MTTQINKQAYATVEDCCPRCKTMIFAKDIATGLKHPLPNQCQFRVKTTSGAWTDIGLCKPCYNEITHREIELIFEGIKEFWFEVGFVQPTNENWKLAEVRKDLVW